MYTYLILLQYNWFLGNGLNPDLLKTQTKKKYYVNILVNKQ